MDENRIKAILAEKIRMPDVKRIIAWTNDDSERLQIVWHLARSGDRRTSVNALWIMTHLSARHSGCVDSLKDNMIDMLLDETDTAKKRMLLQILRNQEYTPDGIRTDFLDYCMSKINSEHEAYAVRCFCMYTAFRMCRHYHELVAELEKHLDMMSGRSLSPGLKSALRQTKMKIQKMHAK